MGKVGLALLTACSFLFGCALIDIYLVYLLIEATSMESEGVLVVRC
jgi:hypothetical protein